MSFSVDKELRRAQNHEKTGNRAEAEIIYKEILTAYPKNKKAIQAYQKLMSTIVSKRLPNSEPQKKRVQDLISLYNEGHFERVLSEVKALISQFPKAITLFNIQGASNAGLQRFDAAITSFKSALKIKPDYAEAYYNIGNAFRDKGEADAALNNYKQALKIMPNHAQTYNNMGYVLHKKGELDAAIKSFAQALDIKPNHAEAYNNIANALKDKGELSAAINNYQKALDLKPEYLEAWYNLGNLLQDNGKLKSAIDKYKKAICIKPDYAKAYFNMGQALKDNGDTELAIQSFEQAIKIEPDYQAAHAQKLHQQAHICDWMAMQGSDKRIPNLGISDQSVDIWTLLSLEDAPERHRLRAEIYVKQKFQQKRKSIHPKPEIKPSRLRIGYFSADFHNHPGMHLMVGMLATHDRDRFEIYAYSYGPDSDDEMRHRVIAAVDVFKEVREMTDPELAMLARHDKIDIAINRNGHTQNSRTGAFAYRAAPVQINYLGYPGTLGADFIDYIVADKRIIPAGSETYFSEKIIHLPHTYQPTDNKRPVSDKPVTRGDMGLPVTGFVFCCFNNNYKISAVEFDIWMRLLAQVEDSVLWLLKSNSWAEESLRQAAITRGITQDRLVFARKTSQPEHLARQRLADLFLDTFNYNAHTTASDALWMGLPVITKMGRGFAARVAGSLLTAMEMPELITKTEQAYEQLALDLAQNPTRLAELRQKIIAKQTTAPLFDTELYTRHLEAGYQQAYGRYLQGKDPADIIV